jgi:hypothetical protein
MCTVEHSYAQRSEQNYEHYLRYITSIYLHIGRDIIYYTGPPMIVMLSIHNDDAPWAKATVHLTPSGKRV